LANPDSGFPDSVPCPLSSVLLVSCLLCLLACDSGSLKKLKVASQVKAKPPRGRQEYIWNISERLIGVQFVLVRVAFLWRQGRQTSQPRVESARPWVTIPKNKRPEGARQLTRQAFVAPLQGAIFTSCQPRVSQTQPWADLWRAVGAQAVSLTTMNCTASP